MQINDGDTVLVRMKVRDAAPMQGEVLRVYGGFSRLLMLVNRTDIVSVEPRPLRVGDRVKDPDGFFAQGEIKAIVDNRAWVYYPSSEDVRVEYIEEIARLTRVSDKPKTRRDVLREAYPEQFERICEVVKEQHHEIEFESPAGDEKAGESLSAVITFASNREGYDHWYKLAKAQCLGA